jgi:hypothetical protein
MAIEFLLLYFVVQSSKSLFGGSTTIERLRALFAYEVFLKQYMSNIHYEPVME